MSAVPMHAPVRRRSPRSRKLFPYLLVMPAVVYLLSIKPSRHLRCLSLALWRQVQAGRAGLDNYRTPFTDHDFFNAIWNTLLLGSITLAVEFVLALTLAALVYRDPWVKGLRIIFLLPMLLMPSAVTFIWKLMFNDGRIISDLMKRLGLIDFNVDWMFTPALARLVVIWTDVWQWTPFLFIIFVAGLQGQDKEVEEAARLDGASWWSAFFNVSLPMLRPIIAVALILRGIDILNIPTPIQLITQGAALLAGPRKPSATTSTARPRWPRLRLCLGGLRAGFDFHRHPRAGPVRRYFRSGTEA
ncbi:MAG: sugar ABC transporter permease [Hyphomicrobiales bacterium]